ncbi:MAG TPA: sigma-54 dependent transcriptional regulator [Bryobacteraceae bacterium]|nr:sigma-54 dependent transcriptional regulator [Bryobacteraceae bacterium]
MLTKRLLWINGAASAQCNGLPPDFRIFHRNATEALQELSTTVFDAIIADFPLPEWTAAELLGQIQRLAPRTPVLIRDLMQADDSGKKLAETIWQALAERIPPAPQQIAEPEEWETMLVGHSPAMRDLREMIRKVGSRRCTVLITGETGTGKELAARALHLAGTRRRKPLVSLNCSAVPDTLLEAELFGHVRGAFTGAVQTRIGRFEQAQGGTLFLDEIGDLPFDLQAKLLRVLQEREFQRLGSSETVRVDIRVVAATNCDLAEKVEQGRFREDLFYRLNVVPLRVPPLRDRSEDIPPLARHFVEKVCGLEGLPTKLLTAEAVERLTAYSWPGNVRQLENAIEMAIALSGDRPVLSVNDFPLGSGVKGRPASTPERSPGTVVSVPDAGLDFQRTVADIERSMIQQALEKTGGNKKAAAQMLRLKRTTLSAKVRNFEALRACG